jgi:hypothetical protein
MSDKTKLRHALFAHIEQKSDEVWKSIDDLQKRWRRFHTPTGQVPSGVPHTRGRWVPMTAPAIARIAALGVDGRPNNVGKSGCGLQLLWPILLRWRKYRAGDYMRAVQQELHREMPCLLTLSKKVMRYGNR